MARDGPTAGTASGATHPEGAARGPPDWRTRLAAIWRDERPKVAIPRDIAIVALLLGIVLVALWGYTGQPFPSTSPLVVIESGSMMHLEAPYGRVGTIDPGDLVMVKAVDSVRDVETTYGPGDREGYGAQGDVLIYRPFGDTERTPIIHRALTYVEVTTTTDDDGNDTHRYTYWNDEGQLLEDQSSVTLASARVHNLRPTHSGFITKGDNPQTNVFADQISHTSNQLVRIDWVVGKARGEIPWLGLVKLAMTGNPIPAPSDTIDNCKVLQAWAPCDEWVMLGLSFGALIGTPFALEQVAKRNERFRRWLAR